MNQELEPGRGHSAPAFCTITTLCLWLRHHTFLQQHSYDQKLTILLTARGSRFKPSVPAQEPAPARSAL